jgi:hypothetical protein
VKNTNQNNVAPQKTSLTISETGTVLVETANGVSMPADYSFATVNDFVHGFAVQFEELQYLCLAMADHIEKLERGEFICKKCGLRKDSEHNETCKF